jgi:predicted transcriptional regulator
MKRSRYRIVSEILDICMDGASKTKIVYRANLNFRTVNPYMEILIEKNLIKVERGRMVLYHTTERGMNLLNEINRIHNALSEL